MSYLDDGSKELYDILDLAKAAVQEGIHTIITTPHYKNGRYENSKQIIIQKVVELNDILNKEGVPLTILPGHVPHYREKLLFGIQIKRLTPIIV